MGLFVGLDVSLKTTSICAVEADGSPRRAVDYFAVTASHPDASAASTENARHGYRARAHIASFAFVRRLISG